MKKTLLALMAAGSVLAYGAGAAAQTAVTDVTVVDNTTRTVADVLMRDALRLLRVIGLRLPGSPERAALKDAVKLQVAQAVEYHAREVVNETLGLEQIEALQFDAFGNKAGVEQGGLTNAAEIDQSNGQSGWALINQLGESTSAVIVQNEMGAAPGPYSLNRAYVGQVAFDIAAGDEGFTQSARITQTYQAGAGASEPNHAVVQQGGVRDRVREAPLVPSRGAGSDNRADIRQSGAANDALIQQGFESAEPFSVMFGDAVGRNNRALVVQVGADNSAVLAQEDDSTSAVHQIGFANTAIVKQDGYVDLNETWSVVEQGDPLGVIASGNFAAVAQYGYNSKSSILQHSDDNEAYVDQTFRAAEAESEITQDEGRGNFASVVQDVGDTLNPYGGRLRSFIWQHGSFNVAIVRQEGAAGSVSLISQNGDNNTAEVSQ